ncbi:Eco57I restriction-modification methylase domain-containing protein [Bacteroides reticulotermitis]|uniref:site-specific DNA-methyltransferase (adenine-specific) n=2 Tax=Bacteroides reticulotermitis TaxID=1133319 RepID=W4UVJ4_9BACE|nr:Eco57I restriction-modification methylase domain-containing protein [Bacteroides reticulotermitis]MBB4042775.1 hypothetical protein [Bacteroides reticulotermitis]GAE85255.1 DNA modification methylase [Bacteroides reticulotermitis JCM 10512]
MEFKEYFQKPYQGGESFLQEVVFPIFGQDNFDDGFNASLLEENSELAAVAASTGITSVCRVGTIQVEFNPIDIYDITVTGHVQMVRNRVAIQQLVRRIMNTYSSAFMIFHYEDTLSWDWRFTFCSKRGSNDETTDSKRYTFLLGPNQSCRTASENFGKLLQKHGDIELKDIEAAFDVEALSKEFFGKYKQHYQRFVDYMCDDSNGMRQDFIDTSFDKSGMADEIIRDREEKPIRDYVKKLLGRIVFLHFLQKKGWMGVPKNKQWGEGDTNFMKHLFEKSSNEQKANFLDEVLEPLFTDALDSDRKDNKYLFDTGVSFEYGSVVKIPYLNGGLFERDLLDEPTSQFPAKYFADLFEFFYQYNFTIDENDPNDAQVGVDPEMLGRIFENLLEDNKDKGAFYTPKEIVQYMCRQSLTAYLQTDITDEQTKTAIDKFVNTYDVAEIGGADSELAMMLDNRLKNVKICDPAIGSGAFPMGLLKELFLCRGAIECFGDAADIKRHIIQHNIYGVDIERGAVDIARLRFWLSLIVEEEIPHSLPNLDYKIMQGNSLLESFMGYDLSTLTESAQTIAKKNRGQVSLMFDETDTKRNIQLYLKQYFSESDHSAKAKIRKNIEYAVKEHIKICSGYIPSVVEAVDNLNIPNDKFFLWHTYFSDVFNQPNDCNGFDIVIGNPPYIQLQNNGGEIAALYENSNFEVFARTGDIYCLFYERGWQLLKPNGHLCYITSNKWMRAGYGEKTRAFFAKKTDPKLLIDFSGVKIFENATVDSNILLFSKSKNEYKTICAVTNKQAKNSIKNLSVFVQQQGVECDFAGSAPWVILSPIEQSIKQKIEAVGTPLKDWDINIYRGVLTGYNEAFIISTEKRDEILANCQSEDERTKTAHFSTSITSAI